ncbi:hypothetical protein B9Z19DRAFT_1123951 [Tuber borchii]|uniref:Uncharacterized protein n=1 Tax=Tuber borchii TaxID=42251 RepID=A0A2T6ZXM8_TUBBO|nr:hypothetical protein B9Z19DRAFT_1123951 [Tuber borchii]
MPKGVMRLQASTAIILTVKAISKDKTRSRSSTAEWPVYIYTRNTIEVFFQIDSHGERAPPTSGKATLEDTKALDSSFEQIDICDKGFYVALDKNYEKIVVMFGAGLRLIYGDKIGEYMEKVMSWKIEEYTSVNVPAILKDTRHKDYEKWLLSNPHLCWPPWAHVTHMRIARQYY